ncbi:MAG: hypothetical protein V7765_21730 [Oleispira sp.]|jgi:hypothetical protein
MKEELKELVGNQKKLIELLECSRAQAWRIWTGKSELTKANEKLIKLQVS